MADTADSAKFSYLHIFPDPYQTLHSTLTPLDDCLQNSLVVLDTNVLLFPFKTGPHALDEIEKALNQLKNEGRLLIPQHALREYLANRPHKIKEFYDQLHKQRNKDYSIPSVAKLIEKVASYHELKAAENGFRDELERLRNAIASAIDEVRQWTTNDPVSQAYRRIFTPEIIIGLRQDIQSLEKEHRERNAQSIPPGYKDSGKTTNSMGDFLIWKTILEIAIGQPGRNLILVSGEEKSDWVYRGSNEILYAREELIEEFRRASAGGTFHLIDFATLLRYLKASDKAVAEVKLEEARNSSDGRSSVRLPGDGAPTKWSVFQRTCETAVGDWLRTIHGTDNVEYRGNHDLFDFAAFDEKTRTETFVEVRSIRHYEHFRKRIAEIVDYLSIRIEEGPLRSESRVVSGAITFVSETKEGAFYIDSHRNDIDKPGWLVIYSGYLENGAYVPLQDFE